MSSSNSPADTVANGHGNGSVDVDRALLAALARDGRASYTELADRVGLSVSAVHQRVRRLEQRGLITGYRATLDAKQLGLPLTAFVSWLCGKAAQLYEPALVALTASRGYETASSKVFMRVTVLICDALLFFPAVWVFSGVLQAGRPWWILMDS